MKAEKLAVGGLALGGALALGAVVESNANSQNKIDPPGTKFNNPRNPIRRRVLQCLRPADAYFGLRR